MKKLISITMSEENWREVAAAVAEAAENYVDYAEDRTKDMRNFRHHYFAYYGFANRIWGKLKERKAKV